MGWQQDPDGGQERTVGEQLATGALGRRLSASAEEQTTAAKERAARSARIIERVERRKKDDGWSFGAVVVAIVIMCIAIAVLIYGFSFLLQQLPNVLT